MKKSVLFFILMLGILSHLFSQHRFTFELKGGASFATEDLADANLNTGSGFEGILEYRLVDQLNIYGGWGWNRFSAAESFAGPESDFEETGYIFGLKYALPFGQSPVALYLKLGGIYNHIEIENKAGTIIADSGHGLGWQIGTGLEINLSDSWQLRPGVKLQSLSREVTLSETTTELDLNYLWAGLGIAWSF
jgi:opacity protein-like surface antigen